MAEKVKLTNARGESLDVNENEVSGFEAKGWSRVVPIPKAPAAPAAKPAVPTAASLPSMQNIPVPAKPTRMGTGAGTLMRTDGVPVTTQPIPPKTTTTPAAGAAATTTTTTASKNQVAQPPAAAARTAASTGQPAKTRSPGGVEYWTMPDGGTRFNYNGALKEYQGDIRGGARIDDWIARQGARGTTPPIAGAETPETAESVRRAAIAQRKVGDEAAFLEAQKALLADPRFEGRFDKISSMGLINGKRVPVEHIKGKQHAFYDGKWVPVSELKRGPLASTNAELPKGSKAMSTAAAAVGAGNLDKGVIADAAGASAAAYPDAFRRAAAEDAVRQQQAVKSFTQAPGHAWGAAPGVIPLTGVQWPEDIVTAQQRADAAAMANLR